MLELQPQLNSIDTAQLGSQQDYLNALQGARSAYGGYQSELQNVPRFPLQQISDELQTQLGKFTGLLNGLPQGVPNEVYGTPVGLPESETQAGTNLYGTYGGNAFGTLASDAARAALYRQSAGREGALAERYARENLIQDLQDQLQGYSQRRMDLSAMTPAMIQQEVDRLTAAGQTQAANDAMAKWLEDYLGAQTTPTDKGSPGKGKPKNKPKGRRKPVAPIAATPNIGTPSNPYWNAEPTGQVIATGATSPTTGPRYVWPDGTVHSTPAPVSGPDVNPTQPGQQGPSLYPQVSNPDAAIIPDWLRSFLFG
jgi:hypothetical protein